MRERVKVFVNQSNLITRRIGDLDDVDLTGNQNGALLVYDSTTQKFRTSVTLQGITLSIDGGTY